MSDMKPAYAKVKLGGKEYSLLFDVNALDEIQDRFDIPITDLSVLIKDQRKTYKVLKFILATLINEAIDDAETGDPHVDEKFIGRKLTPSNLGELQSAVFKAFTAGNPEADEDDIPNAKSE